jgi:Thiamine pyrophosphate enzyme, N-terminal TPP binding domain
MAKTVADGLLRHEESGVFAAVAEASLTGRPAVVCGTAGPGTAHLLNGLPDGHSGRSRYHGPGADIPGLNQLVCPVNLREVVGGVRDRDVDRFR